MAVKKESALSIIYDTLKLVEAYTAAEMAKTGMKSSYKAILPVLALKDGITQLDLVKATGLKAPTISTTLRNMELAGFVRREKYENDLRATLVYLTPQGVELDKKMKSVVKKAEKIVLSGISEDERKIIEPLLKKMKSSISNAVSINT